MRDRLGELGSDTEIALVVFTDPVHLEGYQRAHDLPFPILIDADRATYRAYGLGRGTLGRVWGWQTMRRYGAILRRSGLGRLRPATEDTRQLGGDMVIAPDGTFAWGFWSEGPDHRPTVGTLIAEVARAGQASGNR